ncbi:TadE/TadG family type IV pilus assembly protein [Sphingomonas japonica]|uniref:Flp pilus assembly protein TadG n=1 Tax=Sphingomonas japonica TaxID=511662 RepID=A0ABX0U5G9_9SPHN|nr:TadE family protein [Sphingomonas japonica]NIJ24562.1 Flp pilus assembly protein TadG [Sphingomonas japonica]
MTDRRGVTTVEFAILIPALFTLLCGTIELAHLVFARTVLDGAVVDAARSATASLETSEGDRADLMRESIRKTMRPFPLQPGSEIAIETAVYRDFGSVTAEYFDDANSNGTYDLGESFTDRNANGQWDPSTPIAGELGGPGDVVSYTAVYPKRILFGFLVDFMGMQETFNVRSTTVVRNESVVRRATP